MRRRNGEIGEDEASAQADLFADFNGLPSEDARTEFYQHDANWSNRMILGDSLQVMGSLAEREGLRGKVQCIYIDPPYGIKFNSNFQWSTTSRDVKDGKAEHITREPEQVKAFRDTWRDGIHSYLTYLRDRLTAARDLLTESGSVFVQIGDENVHRVRAVMDEVFGEDNFVNTITFTKTSPLGTKLLPSKCDYVIWFARDKDLCKFRPMFVEKFWGEGTAYTLIELDDGIKRKMTLEEQKQRILLRKSTPFVLGNLLSTGFTKTCYYDFNFKGRKIPQGRYSWKTTAEGMHNLLRSGRVYGGGHRPGYVQKHSDFPVKTLDHLWDDVGGAQDRKYVVETTPKVIQRCILMTTDPGDLVLDPTCGSGTTAYVAEQWGRRWITIDTSRVALALARARIMGARYPWYLLADSRDGQIKEAELARKAPSEAPTYNNIRQGFVYERVPHITLKAIANNAEIDVIWEQKQPAADAARAALNAVLQREATNYKNLHTREGAHTHTHTGFLVAAGGRTGRRIDFAAPPDETETLPSGETAPRNALLEWEVPREPAADWSDAARQALERFWEARIARQKAIDASIAARAEYEYLYDKPYADKKTVRVAGPFTVESLSPHRLLGVDENDELMDRVAEAKAGYGVERDFAAMILDNLKTAGVQQAHKEDRIDFSEIRPWPGQRVCAEGRYAERNGGARPDKRAGVFVGPEFGTVSRPDLVEAAREAADAGFDVLIACAFNYDAHASEFNKLGRVPVLKARMNADLHMAADLKNTGKGNLFVIFGEPDIDIIDAENDQIQVKINGVDVFHPSSGDIRSDNADGIACWFVDTNYNEESFFVRHAYFLGANDPYKSLKTTLKAEINREAWETLRSDISHPFDRPSSGRIAVKVINHLGDEVMKVFRA